MDASSYDRDGYAHLRGLIAPEIARAFLSDLKDDMGPAAIPLSGREHVNLLDRPAFEIYSQFYKPMRFFLWALTPIMREVTGRDLLPTYDYFRIYREGDICRVHSDRLACEHSLSLTLDYSDGTPWALEIETRRTEPSARVDADFGDEDHASIPMEVGDAVLYQGVHHRHGRTTPNPNGWSAHLFLHWVDRNGPYRTQAFDGHGDHAPVNFSFS